MSGGDEQTVPANLHLIGCEWSQFRQDGDFDLQATHFVGTEGRKAGVPERCAFGAMSNGIAQRFAPLDHANAAAKFSVNMDALVEGFARRLETDFEDAPARKWSSPGAAHFRERLAGKQADFDGPDKFLLIGGGDLFCGRRIKVLEHFMQMAPSVFDGRSAQAFANLLRTLR